MRVLEVHFFRGSVNVGVTVVTVLQLLQFQKRLVKSKILYLYIIYIIIYIIYRTKFGVGIPFSRTVTTVTTVTA